MKIEIVPPPPRSAVRIAQAIRRNVDSYGAGRLAFGDFSTRQRALWDRAAERELADDVARMVAPFIRRKA